MEILQELITIPLLWKKVDSHIENKVYKPEVKPNGDEFTIYLNKAVDKWADQAREEMVMDPSVQDKNILPRECSDGEGGGILFDMWGYQQGSYRSNISSTNIQIFTGEIRYWTEDI